jgi:CHAT domain
MRQIRLELLRHGPPHNQLLSPLTEYLALCENHGAVTIRIPIEHNQMLYRLRALSYQLGPEPREFQVIDTAKLISDLLAKIPGLTADLNRQNGSKGGANTDQVTHLRLILSASELALLPFELATSPNGFPGDGQPLSLQTQHPICITRETRRVPDEFIRWPKLPRVLFAFASPPGYEEVPASAHLLALRQALSPWLALSDDLTEAEKQKLVQQRLMVLPDATASSLEQACAEHDFTHVHLLAHGVEIRTAYDQRFGLAFHSSSDPSGMEIVSGERLATILRTPRRDQAGCFTRPAVVTLASCNGGNGGTVTGVGASIGHSLHESGIPLVVASQYPLTFGGSILLVQDMYEGLFWGEDPRELVVGLRRRLHSRFKGQHDWASIVTYASLPPNFDQQLADACIQQAISSINIALRIADRAIETYSTQSSKRRSQRERMPTDRLESVRNQVADAKKHLERAIAIYPSQKARILVQLASTEKREAQMLYYTNGNWNPDSQEALGVLQQLERSRALYWETYQLRRSNAWELVQYLSLTLLLQSLDPTRKLVSRTQLMAHWLAAEMQAVYDAQAGDINTRAWANSDLAELYLLAPIVDGIQAMHVGEDFAAKACSVGRKLVALTGASSFMVFSTRRQILRYLDWFSPMASGAFIPLEASARQLLEELPEGEEPEWSD